MQAKIFRDCFGSLAVSRNQLIHAITSSSSIFDHNGSTNFCTKKKKTYERIKRQIYWHKHIKFNCEMLVISSK